LKAYWDTSAIIPLYVREINSEQAASCLAAQAGGILLTPLHQLEFANALELLLFRREINRTAAKAAHAAWMDDRRHGVFVPRPLPEAVFATAVRLAESETARRGTRSLDVLHVAAAVDLEADRFLTFDRRQKALAAAAGLKLVRQ